MSANSQRRTAEMAVIDAAIGWKRKYFTEMANGTRPNSSYPGEFELADAVAKLQALGLAAPTGAPTNHDAPQTAHDAATEMRTIVGSVAGKVFREILAAHYDYNIGGLTTDAIEVRLKGTHQGISPRITELRDKGWVIDSGLRRLTRSGRKAIVWKATQLGLEASRLVPEWSW